MSAPYGQIVNVTADIVCECWNYNGSESSGWVIPKGSTVELLYAYDSKTTNVFVKSGPGVTLPSYSTGNAPFLTREVNGKLFRGYKFIIGNWDVNEKTDCQPKIPLQTEDLVGDIIAHETGTATKKQTRRLFSTLKKSGLGKRLQGHYSSRM